jgi:hypothetical protein
LPPAAQTEVRCRLRFQGHEATATECQTSTIDGRQAITSKNARSGRRESNPHDHFGRSATIEVLTCTNEEALRILGGEVTYTVVSRDSPHRRAWVRARPPLCGRTLISHMGFLNRCARLRFVHTPRTPSSREPGDSRRASAVRGYRCAFQDCRDRLRSCVTRVCPNVTKLAPSVPPGVASTRGLVCTNSGGSGPDRIQRPAAGTRRGGSGDEHSGRSRRCRYPWGDIGGATAYPPASGACARRDHTFPPSSQRRVDARHCGAPRADRHAGQPGSRDRPVAGPWLECPSRASWPPWVSHRPRYAWPKTRP